MGILNNNLQVINYTPAQYALAHSKLIEANAVQSTTTGQEYVEGKVVLEVSGLSLANPRAELKRQITKHGFIEGSDYSCSMVATPSGQRTKEYHFTIHAAHHVLLAAMTEQGKLARDEVIETKLAETQFSNDPLLAQMQMMMSIRQDQLVHQEKLLQLEQSHSDVLVRLSNVEDKTQLVGNLKQGYIGRKDAWVTYGSCVSYDVFKKFANNLGMPEEPYHYYRDGKEESDSRQYRIDHVQTLVNHIKLNAVQVTPFYFTHPDYKGRFHLNL